MEKYRIFVGAFPQGELAARLQQVRRRYDPPTARVAAPHVTLAGTYWRSGPPTPANEAAALARLQASLTALPAFDLALGGVCTFPPVARPVIYLGVELTPELLAVRRALLDVLGADKHVTHFTPHLTLAMRLNATRAGRMLEELSGGEWDARRWIAPIRNLQLMQRGDHDPTWREIGRWTLALRP